MAVAEEIDGDFRHGAKVEKKIKRDVTYQDLVKLKSFKSRTRFYSVDSREFDMLSICLKIVVYAWKEEKIRNRKTFYSSHKLFTLGR